ncbi:MAG: hypothetical protein DU481_10630 [Nitrosomonas sp.]
MIYVFLHFQETFLQTLFCSYNLGKFRGFMLRLATEILRFAASFNAKMQRGMILLPPPNVGKNGQFSVMKLTK